MKENLLAKANEKFNNLITDVLETPNILGSLDNGIQQMSQYYDQGKYRDSLGRMRYDKIRQNRKDESLEKEFQRYVSSQNSQNIEKVNIEKVDVNEQTDDISNEIKSFSGTPESEIDKERENRLVFRFSEVGVSDTSLVGGKSANLGEMLSNLSANGIRVPEGFTTTSKLFNNFLEQTGIKDKLAEIFVNADSEEFDMRKASYEAQKLIMMAKWPKELEDLIVSEYKELCKFYGVEDLSVAVRSSATTEDLQGASSAGQQATYLGVKGEKAVLRSVQECIASLYEERAISYRKENKQGQIDGVALSVGVQKIVRSDLGASGVMFTKETETGADVIQLTSAYGLGENVVQGTVNVDSYTVLPESGEIINKTAGTKDQRMVFKPEREVEMVDGLPKLVFTENIGVSRKQQAEFSLTDDEVKLLAKWAKIIEDHYKEPMDVEFARDGVTDELFVVQARPITKIDTPFKRAENGNYLVEQYSFDEPEKTLPKPIVKGEQIGAKYASGKVFVITEDKPSKATVKRFMDFVKLNKNVILVAKSTNPDYGPMIDQARRVDNSSLAIVTNQGGRTCHAAIISREKGIPTIVGASGVLNLVKTGDEITIGNGCVYAGNIPFSVENIELENITERPKTKVLVNVGNPDEALKASQIPSDGGGLARLEFIIAEQIKVHPNALVHLNTIIDREGNWYDKNGELIELSDEYKSDITKKIQGLTHSVYPSFEPREGFSHISQTYLLDPITRLEIQKLIGPKYIDNPEDYFVDKLSNGVCTIAGAFAAKDPNGVVNRPVIFRTSDLKSNEYEGLVGGKNFEKKEENPMIGERGASRYASEGYATAFELECIALKRSIDQGAGNIKLMIPFVRTVDELKEVLEIMKTNGLERGKDGLEVYIMCEIPSNVLVARKFLELCDGFSIGSNDLTQLTLGIDRDAGSQELQAKGDPRNEAVVKSFMEVLQVAKDMGKYVGICGQAPSDYPEVAEFLVENGISSISLNPEIDTVVNTTHNILAVEKARESNSESTEQVPE